MIQINSLRSFIPTRRLSALLLTLTQDSVRMRDPHLFQLETLDFSLRRDRNPGLTRLRASHPRWRNLRRRDSLTVRTHIPTTRPNTRTFLGLIQINRTQLIQSCFEIVEYDRVGEKLEHKGKFPEWVEAVGKHRLKGVGHRADVGNCEDDREHHGKQHDAEAWREVYEFEQAEVVSLVYVIKEAACCVDPPWIPIRY